LGKKRGPNIILQKNKQSASCVKEFCLVGAVVN